ncbi:50S ribosomal protein L6 [bacterium]|nr:50S ribosomal protein L6 [bacterium]
MSRIGKLPIAIPDKVKVNIEEQHVSVTGPLGELNHTFVPEVEIKTDDGNLIVNRRNDDKRHRAMHGLSRSLLANMVEGVSNGFSKTVLIVGVGYSAELKGSGVLIRVGYSHPVWLGAPPGVTFEVLSQSQWEQYGITKQAENQNFAIRVSGSSKQLVGQVAARLRRIRPPEPYKGKGIRYLNEQVRRKAGKAAKK